jgi:hypothetical protein
MWNKEEIHAVTTVAHICRGKTMQWRMVNRHRKRHTAVHQGCQIFIPKHLILVYFGRHWDGKFSYLLELFGILIPRSFAIFNGDLV